MSSAVNGGLLARLGAVPLDVLPQFDVRGLLELALGKIDSAELHPCPGGVVQAARKQIVAILAAQPQNEDERSHAERTLRLAAKNLLSLNDRHVESARLALMSAADMLRPSAKTPIEQPDSPSEAQPEIPKVGSTDAPGG